MSNDIWHKPDELPPEDSYIVVKLHSGKCEVGFDFEYDFDNIEKWAFFDDLLALETELDRTRKALDVAVDALKSAHDYYEYCIQRDKDYGSDDINWDCTAMNMDNDISEAIDKITALEQKD